MSTLHRRPSRTAGRPLLPLEPVSLEDAARMGWSASAVRHAVATGSAVRPHRGVIVGAPASHPSGAVGRWQAERQACLLTARAGAVACDRTVLSHWPAALTYGMPSVGTFLRPCLTVPAGTALHRLAGVHLHRATLDEQDVVTVGERSVTSPERTVLDIAREHGITAAVVAADHALHTGLADASELAAALDRCEQWPGVTRARRTLGLCDARSESPLESMSRLRLVSSPLPAPELQVPICDLDGRLVARPDFLWDEFGVIGEADGEGKYADDPDAMRLQRIRERELQQLGLVVVRWGHADLRQFHRVVDRLAMACRRGARPGSPDRRWGRLLDRA